METGIILNQLSNLFRKIADNIDCGNSNMSEEEALELVSYIKIVTDKTERISKYEACRYLNVSRAAFDNYVREGLLPRGKHHIGFKELSWDKKTLDEFIASRKAKRSTGKIIYKHHI